MNLSSCIYITDTVTHVYTGNRGGFVFDNNVSVYISRDGGLTWNQVNIMIIFNCTYHIHTYILKLW